MRKELPVCRIFFWVIQSIGKLFGYTKLVRSNRSAACDVSIKTLLSSSIFLCGSVTRYSSDF